MAGTIKIQPVVERRNDATGKQFMVTMSRKSGAVKGQPLRTKGTCMRAKYRNRQPTEKPSFNSTAIAMLQSNGDKSVKKRSQN